MSDDYVSLDSQGVDYNPVDNFGLTNITSAPTMLDNSSAYTTGDANNSFYTDSSGNVNLGSFITTGDGVGLDGTVATVPTVGTATYVPIGTQGSALASQGTSTNDWVSGILTALGKAAPAVAQLATTGSATPAVTTNSKLGSTTATPSTHTLLMVGVVGLLLFVLFSK